MTKEIILDFVAWYGIYRPGLEGGLVIRKSRDINTGTMVNLWEEVFTSNDNVGTYYEMVIRAHIMMKITLSKCNPVSCNKEDAVFHCFSLASRIADIC